MRSFAIALIVQGVLGLAMAIPLLGARAGALAVLGLAAASVIGAGVLLLRDHRFGFPLAVATQALQAVQITTEAFSFQLEVGLAFIIGGAPIAVNIVAAGLLVGIISQRRAA